MNVVDLWWEDETTLCVENDKGEVWRFDGAYVKNFDWRFEDDENVTVTWTPLSFEKVKL
jgi:hypothetical protein